MQIAHTRNRIPHLLQEHLPYMTPYTTFLSLQPLYESQDTVSLSQAPQLGMHSAQHLPYMSKLLEHSTCLYLTSMSFNS